MPLISSNYVGNCQLVIDVGGTNIDIYRLKPNSFSYFLFDSLKSPNSGAELYILLSSIIGNFSADFLILGLPGPVHNNSSIVFCPPLGFSIDITLIHQKHPNLYILNDTECLSYVIVQQLLGANPLMCSNYNNTSGIICTIGTSFGLASYNYFQEVSSILVESFEIAHIPLILTSRLCEILKDSQFSEFQYLLLDQHYSQVLSGIGFKKLTSLPSFLLLMNKLYPIITVTSSIDAFSLLICELFVSVCQLFAPRSMSFILHGGVLNALDQDKLTSLFNHVFLTNNLKDVSLRFSCMQ
ncbi:hypothetical protein [Synechococcus sp. UW140]|uniref:hypothetical protein n=1 Tax=Synechococcus sp. UW140 TaxID=368503 RepID=UPI003137E5BF